MNKKALFGGLIIAIAVMMIGSTLPISADVQPDQKVKEKANAIWKPHHTTSTGGDECRIGEYCGPVHVTGQPDPCGMKTVQKGQHMVAWYLDTNNNNVHDHGVRQIGEPSVCSDKNPNAPLRK